jgi:phage baseplate assembly protein W
MSTKTYIDLDAAMGLNPRTRDVAVKTNDNAIRGALRNLIHTNHYDRPFHPEIGCQISTLLFENMDRLTGIIAERTIRDSIRKHEPRVEVLEVTVSEMYDSNALNISVVYKIRNTNEVSQFTTKFTRIR